jgi:lipoprotein-anchoring transpeptidase ErfK/SrfK
MSHGCVHVSNDNAERTFDYLDYGDHVDILS